MKTAHFVKNIFVVYCLGVSAIFCATSPKPNYKITAYANIEINISDVKRYTQDGGVYLGPPAIDIDDSGSIYLLNALDNAIEKHDRKGNRIWKTINENTIFDIKTYGSSIFSFDGKNVYEYDLSDGKPLDTFEVALSKDEITPVGNVSEFYGRYLFINKWFIKDKQQLFVFDLSERKLSPRVPVGNEFYPITKCQACSLSFVKSLFENKTNYFVNQSDSDIVYLVSDSNENIKPQVYIFNKNNGEVKVLRNIAFFKDFCLTTIRFILFNSKSELICCTLVQEKYIPKRLKFYKLTIN